MRRFAIALLTILPLTSVAQARNVNCPAAKPLIPLGADGGTWASRYDGSLQEVRLQTSHTAGNDTTWMVCRRVSGEVSDYLKRCRFISDQGVTKVVSTTVTVFSCKLNADTNDAACVVACD
jgi:hypothetical protein